MLRIGDTFPDFECETSQGSLKTGEYFKDTWGILFSHPLDFTPVCTTELGRAAALSGEFAKRGVKMAALSCDTVEQHKGWIPDIEKFNGGAKVEYPIIADAKREIASRLGMLDPEEKDAAGLPAPVRAVFFLHNLKVKALIYYPPAMGRDFGEILRVIDGLQSATKAPIAIPVDWTPGSDVMVLPTVSEDDAKAKFPDHKKVEVPSGKGYIRMTSDPGAGAAAGGAAGGGK